VNTAGLTVTSRTVPAGGRTAVVLAFDGVIDLHTGPAAREALQDARLDRGDLLVLDLAGVTVCDSTGISILVAARNRAQAAGAGIMLATVPGHVARRLHIVGLESVLPVHASVDAATAAWQP
jgi:anti-sigma B factor antagonist